MSRVKLVEEYETESIRRAAPYGLTTSCLVSPLTGVGMARSVYEKRHGKIGATKILVCHRCDEPRCIEDTHHFLGSHRENIKDAFDKGRLTDSLEKAQTASNEGVPRAKKLAALNTSSAIETRLRALCSPEGRAKNSAGQVGRKHSVETRAKLRAATFAHYAKLKEAQYEAN